MNISVFGALIAGQAVAPRQSVSMPIGPNQRLRLLSPYVSLGVSQPAEGLPMSTCVFIQIRCRPGSTYRVAEEVALREIHSELYSTSGDYDLLMKLYIPAGKDIGVYINDNLLDIEGIERSLTTMTFKAF
jgi:DNA-binding Lrp family transcriptional regulator